MNILGYEFDLVLFILDKGVEIVGIILGFLYFYFQKKKKRFSYEIISESPLYSIHDEELKDRLKIYLDDTLVDDLNLLIIKFMNNGNVDVSSRDFETPVFITFNEDAEILGYEIIEKYPETMEYDMGSEKNRYKINKNLFNVNYYVTIKLLISKYKEIKQIHGGILGIEKIEEITEDTIKETTMRYIGIAIGLLGFIAYLVYSSIAKLSYPINIILFVYMILGATMAFFPQYFKHMIKISEKK